jgi:two-component system, cell cycle sensor histidine kinase and response regulator CckA
MQEMKPLEQDRGKSASTADLYETIFEHAPMGIAICDSNGTLVSANKKWLELVGVSDFSLIQSFQLFDSPSISAADRARLRAGTPIQYESVLDFELLNSRNLLPTSKSGRIYLSVVVQPVNKLLSKGAGFVALAQDITERKLAEEALRASEDRFRRSVEHSPIAMAIVAMDGTIEYINRKAIKVFGYLPEDIPTMERWWFQAYPDEAYRNSVVADWIGRIQKAMTEEGEIAGNNYQVTCKDGSVKTMFISGTPVAGKVFVLFDDITERMNAQEALRESEERFSKVFRISPYAYLIASMEDGRILEVNDAFTTLCGYSREEALGRSTIDLGLWVTDSDRGRMVATVREKGTVDRIETMLRAKNGSAQTVLFSARLIRVGNKPCIISVVEDITERKKSEALLINAQKLESLGVLAGGIAHDFNNLLTGIFGYVDLARSVSKDGEVTEYLEATLASMNRAKALTLQLLTFAKGGSPVRKTTPMAPVIREAAQFALSGSNVASRLSLADDLWPCDVDKHQIGQVIDNIVINAQQAMPSGGTIDIAAKNLALKAGDHPSLAEGDYVKVSMKDSGIGIPRDIMPRIFDPFYTTKTKGHGLGLATCYSIIQRHGGCIEVESEAGKGSTFHVYLPASAETVGTERATVARHRGSGRIMVMDDEAVIRDLTRKMLEALGYGVVCKSDGREAIDFYLSETRENQRFAAMIFDLTVPGGMGGMEAVREIRKLDKEIPLFIMSGYSSSDLAMDGTKDGVNGSINKPFTLMELGEMLERCLKK